MINKKEQTESNKLSELSNIAISKLPSKQKIVRTTIRISKEGHEVINTISESKQAKNAEVFNSILELAKIFIEKEVNLDLNRLKKTETIRKTYVINKDTLTKLTQVASQINVSRDVLINQTIKLMKFLIEKELQERINKYSKYLKRIDNALAEINKIEYEMKEELEDEDPVLCNLGMLLTCADNQRMEMDEYVYENKPVKKG